MSSGDAARVVIRGVVVPLGLGLFELSREGYRIGNMALLDFLAAYIYGAFLLGALSLGVWIWNLLDLLGIPPGGSRRCPRCRGGGRIPEQSEQ
jgi:hypothetical protein